MTAWEPVIGLELHAQLRTRSKLFSDAPAAYGAPPNTQACEIDLGLPGVLPVPNVEAVRLGVLFGLAIGAEIAPCSVFARKSYFYPDLPKGYQISQYEQPLLTGGHIDVPQEDGADKRVPLTRAHLEEDAGKLVHDAFPDASGVDLNRAGVPLLEIVSEPALRSPAEAAAFMRRVRELLRWLGVCDGNMQEGSLRCDANVSVRPAGDETLGVRTEIKNLNSFRFVEKAIGWEIERHIELREAGREVAQETRLFDAGAGRTRAMRGKEDAHDYRYFPDPDLPPLLLDAAFIERERAALPELPDARRRRFAQDYDLPPAEAAALTGERATADFFEDCARATRAGAREVAHWLAGPLAGLMSGQGGGDADDADNAGQLLTPARLAELLDCVADGAVSRQAARTALEVMQREDGAARDIVRQLGLEQVSDAGALAAEVERVVAANPSQVKAYRAGREKLHGFFVGQVMKAMRGKGDPVRISELVTQKLKESDGG